MKKLNLGLVWGSIREGRFCDTVAGWAAMQIERHGGFELDPIDPKALGVASWRAREDRVLAALGERIDRADAFVVVTPEYNHGYPAPLKALIDAAHGEWRAKPVGFVSYGGISGGLRAVEQLRLVFAELHAVTMRDTVSLANPWNQFDDAGELIPEAPQRAMGTMLRHLDWWAGVLRDARRGSRYRALCA